LRGLIHAQAFGHACNTGAGRFVVREVVRDPGSGAITSFAADFEHYCDGQDLPVFGALRYQSTVPLDLDEPTAAAGLDQIALERGTVVLDGRHSMPGAGDITEWRWRQVSGPPVTLSGSDESIATFTAPTVSPPGETLQFELQAVNSAGLSDSDVIDVFVQDKVSPRSYAFVIGDGAIGLLLVGQQLLLLPQDGVFEVVDHGEGPSKMHLQWRGAGYDWLFNVYSNVPLAVGHYDMDSDLGEPRTNVIAAAAECGNRVRG
jgi:K319-like protein